jgi:hypothetical protein
VTPRLKAHFARNTTHYLFPEYFQNLCAKKNLSRTSEKVGLKIIMRLNTNAATNIEVGSEIIEEVEDFTYLGSIISGEEGVLKNVAPRIARSNEILG